MEVPAYLLVLLILPSITCSFLSNNDKYGLIFPNLFESDTERLIKPEAHGYDINITFDLASVSNYDCSLIITTQQLDTLFPPMTEIQPPQDVVVNVFSNIRPFHILNFTHFHLSVDAVLQVSVFLPVVSNIFPYATFNISGFFQLELLPVYASLKFRLYIKDFAPNSVTPSPEDSDKVNPVTIQAGADMFGQLAIDYVNFMLGQKTFMMSEGGYLMPEEPVGTYKDDFMTVEVKTWFDESL